MRIHFVTLRYSPQDAAFDDAPLRAALGDARIVSLREYFFVTQDLPHLLCVVTCEATVSPASRRAGSPAIPCAPDASKGTAADPTPRPCPRDDLNADGQVVYDRLRRWRAQTAKQEGVPPYVVLTNRQLSGIVQAKPESKAALGRVEGVGDKKVERYGAALLAMLAPAEATAEATGEATATPAETSA